MSYTDNGLFRKHLAARPNDEHEKSRDLLRSEYDKFWKRGISVAKRISDDFPGLTLHDEEHLSAVWDRAYQLTGDNYDFNPLECFVLGAVIITHDIGHALSTYEGGPEGLKQSVQYKDNLAKTIMDRTNCQAKDVDLGAATADDLKTAIFSTARQLHAEQAPKIISHPLYGTSEYLLEDKGLRTDLGDLIGLIATSHNWSLGRVEQQVPDIQGAPGYLPQVWRINPQKIACLIRCADAIQIDQRRAPHFSFALHNPTGLSRLHWLAQQLAQPVVNSDKEPPGRLVFTSQKNIELADADAWWIAYELVGIANKELGDCYQFMKDRSIPIFTVDRVDGSDNPAKLAFHIRPAGWNPIKAEVKISDVDHIVRLFGGFGLYGNDLVVPLRELVQNASDAVRARRAHEKDEAYKGRVDVSISNPDSGGFRTLTVEDNGIGMSQAVMVGPLLEFGKSFWSSDSLKYEFPGLMSAKLAQIGRFGIGFFSSFMVSSDIVVTSVKYQASRSEAKSLIFKNSTKIKPIMAPSQVVMRGSVNTRVDIRVTDSQIEQMLSISDRLDRIQHAISLKELIAHLCPTLDCDVFTKFGDESFSLAHGENWSASDRKEWLGHILLNKYRSEERGHSYVFEMAGNLREIRSEDGTVVGMAAINTTGGDFGLDNIGGFASGSHARSLTSLSDTYIGSLRREPDGPRRGAGPLAPSQEAIAHWASQQAAILSDQKLSLANSYYAASNVCSLGGDPASIAAAVLNREFAAIGSIVDLLVAGSTIYAPVASRGDDEKYFSLESVTLEITSYSRTHLRPDEIDLRCNVVEAWRSGTHKDKGYHSIALDGAQLECSLIGCLDRLCISRGFRLNIEFTKDHLFGIYIGPPSERDKIETGKELRQHAILLSCEKLQ